jgi:ketosteroid isomerase-like protein
VGAFGGAVVGGDLDTALEIIHADCTWIYAGPDRIPFAGSYHGPDGVAAYLQKFGEEMEILSFEPTLTVDGDLVILRAKELNRHKISGRELNLDVTQVYEVRNGQIIFFQEFVDTAAILALYS